MGGRLISNLRYADDIVLLASSANELQELVDRVHAACAEFGLKINIKKTKVMRCCTEVNNLVIKVNNEKLEEVSDYQYLGFTLTSDARCDTEIRRRLGMARAVISKLSSTWKSRQLSIPTKLRLLKALVWSVASYGCEGWTLTSTLEDKVRAFGNICYRRILRIPWTAKKTNAEIRHMVGEECGFLAEVCRRKLTYFGHVMRHNSLQKDIMVGMVPGTRRRGRPRLGWLHNVSEWTRLSLCEAASMAWSRVEWRGLIRAAVNAVDGRQDT